MKCEVCNHHVGNRRRVGPTGKDFFMIRVDSCYECGTIYPVDNLTYKERNWVDRWNKRIKNELLRIQQQ